MEIGIMYHVVVASPQPWDAIAEYVGVVAGGLQFATEDGVIHLLRVGDLADARVEPVEPDDPEFTHGV